MTRRRVSKQFDIDRLTAPLIIPFSGDVPTRAKQLHVEECPSEYARLFVQKWHSRLPKTQRGPWQYAFRAVYAGVCYAVALWHNPSARTLPSHWLELRRMAVADDAPHCTASRFLAMMTKWFRQACSEREMCISYQDTAVHKGTIYLAAGWTRANVQAARARDRSGLRPSGRPYRTSLNGIDADGAEKVRWQLRIGAPRLLFEPAETAPKPVQTTLDVGE